LRSGAAPTPAARATATRRATCARLERDRRGKQALGRSEVQRAPVAGEHEARTTAERTAAAAAAAATTGRLVWRRRRHACQLPALHVDDVVATSPVGGARAAAAATG